MAEKAALSEGKWEKIGGVRIRRPNTELQKPHVVKGYEQSIYAREVSVSANAQNQPRMVEKVIRFLWDGNTILHEWEDDTNSSKKPHQKIDYQADYVVKLPEKRKQEAKEKTAKGELTPESLVTWIFQDDFIPRAKITKDGCYSIMTDYLGTPVGAYDEAGNLVWERELDINGKIIPSGKDSYGRRLKEVGEKTFIPFRFQGQYEDEETGLYYNRFRYYDPETGQYTQQDPIGLAGGNPTLYGYVYNTLDEIDPFGLHEILADSDLVVRGGTCTAETFKKGSGIAQDSITGKLTGISTQAKPGAELKTLANPFPHNQVGVATVGDIERAGGIITLDGQLNSTSNAYYNFLCENIKYGTIVVYYKKHRRYNHG